MKKMLRAGFIATLLAGLCAAVVPAPTAAHTQRLVEITHSGINIRSGAAHVVIGNAGIRITGTGSARSTVISHRAPPCPNHRQLVAIGHNERLAAGQTACDVVTIFGNSTVKGDITDSVVAIMGNARVTGTVANSVVTIFGNSYINNTVGGNTVSIFGNTALGPQASVRGQTVNLFGTVKRAPSAVTARGTVSFMSGIFPFARRLQAWSEHCLMLGRLLAPRRDIAWAWGLALGILAFYLLLAALLHDSLRHCIRTLEDHPGPAILAALVMVLLTPVMMFALMIGLTVTVVGIVFIPLLWIALLCVGVFGRVIALGWLGSRVLRNTRSGAGHAVLQVLVGGLLVLALYMVPVLGFIVYTAIGLVGFGTLTYAIILSVRAARSAAPPPHYGAPVSPAAATAAGADPAGATAATSGSAGTAGAAAAMSAGGEPAAAAHLEPTPLELTALPRAGFWIRMAALLIDVILIGFVLRLIDHHGSSGMLIALAAYGALMWKLRGTTVGGIICNLRVVRIDGNPINWEVAILRALGCLLSLVALGLGFFWIAFDTERQAWHDKIAGTVVVLMPKVKGLI